MRTSHAVALMIPPSVPSQAVLVSYALFSLFRKVTLYSETAAPFAFRVAKAVQSNITLRLDVVKVVVIEVNWSGTAAASIEINELSVPSPSLLCAFILN